MSGNLILIGKSGAMAARAALDLTAQNIANATNPSYARRSLSVAEVAAHGGMALHPDGVLSGVRPDRVLRSDSLFLQTEARRTHSDLARAQAELAGLAHAESAVEQAGIHPAIVEFEASLARLAADPLDGPLRAAVLESGRTLAQGFAIASSGLDVAAQDLAFKAQAGAEEVNLLAGELARTNAAIARARPGTSGMAVLHDQRDDLLQRMAGQIGIETQFDALGRVTVSSGGTALLEGTINVPLGVEQDGNGALSFTLGGVPVMPASGSLPGMARALDAIAATRAQLDSLASQIVTALNAAQAGGTAPDGQPGAPFFSGSTARDISLSLESGAGIATAPAGAGAGSRDIGNLKVLQASLATDGPAQSADRLLFTLSSTLASRTVTRDALQAIAETAGGALAVETGVDLDQEAANLLRFQQAFQASGRVIQVASDLFDTLLGIR